MAFTGLAILLSVFVLKCFHHKPDKPVPPFMRTIFLRVIAKCVGMGNLDRSSKIYPSDLKLQGNPEEVEENETTKLEVSLYYSFRHLQNIPGYTQRSNAQLPTVHL